METEDVDYGEPTIPSWYCESCGYETRIKPMPKDREAFYAKVEKEGKCPVCPKCKSETFMPHGF